MSNQNPLTEFPGAALLDGEEGISLEDLVLPPDLRRTPAPHVQSENQEGQDGWTLFGTSESTATETEPTVARTEISDSEADEAAATQLAQREQHAMETAALIAEVDAEASVTVSEWVWMGDTAEDAEPQQPVTPAESAQIQAEPEAPAAAAQEPAAEDAPVELQAEQEPAKSSRPQPFANFEWKSWASLADLYFQESRWKLSGFNQEDVQKVCWGEISNNEAARTFLGHCLLGDLNGQLIRTQGAAQRNLHDSTVVGLAIAQGGTPALTARFSLSMPPHPRMARALWTIAQAAGYKHGRVALDGFFPGTVIDQAPAHLGDESPLLFLNRNSRSWDGAKVLYPWMERADEGWATNDQSILTEHVRYLEEKKASLVISLNDHRSNMTHSTSLSSTWRYPALSAKATTWIETCLSSLDIGGVAMVTLMASKEVESLMLGVAKVMADRGIRPIGVCDLPLDILFLNEEVESVSNATGRELIVFKRFDAEQINPKKTNPVLSANTFEELRKAIATGSMVRKEAVMSAAVSEVALRFLPGDIEEGAKAFAQAMRRYVASISRKEAAPRRIIAKASDVAETLSRASRREGSVVIKDGQVGQIFGGDIVERKGSARHLMIAGRLSILRDMTRAHIGLQIAGAASEAEIEASLERLNKEYDEFVSLHGPINSHENIRAFVGDPDRNLVRALEDGVNADNEEGVRWVKSRILLTRVLEKAEPLSASDEREAVSITVAMRGFVDLNLVADLLGCETNDARERCLESGAAFISPCEHADHGEDADLVAADEYLSGDIKATLSLAKAAGLSVNVKALEEAMPKPVRIGDIDLRIGSTWIPLEILRAFGREFVSDRMDLDWDAATSSYRMDTSKNSTFHFKPKFNSAKADAKKIFADSLAGRVVSVYESNVIDQDATLAAREKQVEMQEGFAAWVLASDSMADEIERVYNELFNRMVPRRFSPDAVPSTLLGMSNAYILSGVQRRGIARAVQSPNNTLLAHAVGAGKTLELICTAMEFRRLGIARKPLIAVPTHQVLDQFAVDFMRTYPSAQILAESAADQGKNERQALFARIAAEDVDAVLITHATLDAIRLSKEDMAVLIEPLEIEAARIEGLLAVQGQGLNKAKQERLVKRLAAAKERIAEMQDGTLTAQAEQDGLLGFGDLGIDALLLDEAHYYKNLPRKTRLATRISTGNSQRATFLEQKIIALGAKRMDSRGVVFATGTPISNSISEIWVMEHYLIPQVLKASSVAQFDEWVSVFAREVPSLELAPDGVSYRVKNRFSRFVNVPEMVAMFGITADVVNMEDLDTPRPASEIKTITTKPSPRQKEYIEGIVDSSSNMLEVTTKGRLAAMDMRLVLECENDWVGSKINAAIREVHSIWESTRKQRAVQLIFCDIGTPGGSALLGVHLEIKRKLVNLGIPEHEIVLAADWKNEAIRKSTSRDLRNGKSRIAIGTTNVMGVGTNVQDRVVAIHEIDAPWRPSDVEQRAGRAVRQGNMNSRVSIHRYVTEGTFDAYVWQTLETKARFVAQAMHGNITARSVEDVENAALSYAEVKALASGNPLVMEKAGLDAEIAKLSARKANWIGNMRDKLNAAKYATWEIERVEERIARYKEIAQEAHHLVDFRIGSIGIESASDLADRLVAMQPQRGAKPSVLRAGPFAIEVRRAFAENDATAVDISLNDRFVETAILKPGDDYRGSRTRSINGLFGKVISSSETIASLEAELAKFNESIAEAKAVESGKGFPEGDRIAFIAQRLREVNRALGIGSESLAEDLDGRSMIGERANVVQV